MILSAHQPTYLSWCGTFAKIASADKFCIFDCVPFSRHDYANRVQIKTHTGVQWLTIPVEHTGERKLLKDVRIAQGNWQRKHLRAIEVAYAKAPHFDYLFPRLRTAFSACQSDNLAEFNFGLLEWLLAELKIDTPIVHASDYEFVGEKSELVLNMCKQMGASHYIFGAKGRDYADVPSFGFEGITVEFQDYVCKPYPQFHGEFVAGLSVIDLLMNCGNRSLDVIMDRA